MDLHPQDWILIIEALAHWAGPPDDPTPRQDRAYEINEDIAAEQGLPAYGLILQFDDRKFT